MDKVNNNKFYKVKAKIKVKCNLCNKELCKINLLLKCCTFYSYIFFHVILYLQYQNILSGN